MASDIITNSLAIGTQLPLNGATFIKTLAELQTLGTSNAKAFTYHEDMVIHVVENHNDYVWREATAPDETGGVLASNYTYPDNIVVDGITYSNRVFNFFLIETGASTVFGQYTHVVGNPSNPDGTFFTTVIDTGLTLVFKKIDNAGVDNTVFFQEVMQNNTDIIFSVKRDNNSFLYFTIASVTIGGDFASLTANYFSSLRTADNFEVNSNYVVGFTPVSAPIFPTLIDTVSIVRTGTLFKSSSAITSIYKNQVGNRIFVDIRISTFTLADSLTGQARGNFQIIPTANFLSPPRLTTGTASFGTSPGTGLGEFTINSCFMNPNGSIVVIIDGSDLSTSASETDSSLLIMAFSYTIE